MDVIAEAAGRRVAIQCKYYRSSVGNDAVQQVFAGMRHYGCNECAVITNSGFTRAATELAQSTGCQLIDGRNLLRLIHGEMEL